MSVCHNVKKRYKKPTSERIKNFKKYKEEKKYLKTVKENRERVGKN